MSVNQYRGELERKRKQRVDAEKKAADYRSRESSKRAQAARARQLRLQPSTCVSDTLKMP